MKIIEAYQCDFCQRIFTHKECLPQHEEICRWEQVGDAVWVENGDVKHSPKVPGEIFGPHKYSEHGTSDCKYGCGCWAGETRSGGKVDPFGPCPCNPKINKVIGDNENER